MAIYMNTKRTGFFEEIASDKQNEFFKIKSHKFLPMIDNLYFSLFIQNDDKENDLIEPLIKKLDEKKAEALNLHEPVEFGHGLMLSIKRYSFYGFCLTEPDLYDIFIIRTLPNDNTPRIMVQLRAFGLWTRGVETIMLEAFERVEKLLAGYKCKIENSRESRIDYCFHTNSISSPNKIFKETGGIIKNLHTNLKHATSHSEVESVEKGTILHKDYICFGRKDSNNVRARVYDKVKEVLQMGYKGFFFQLWYDNGLISYYDKWCFEYAFPYKNVDYLAKARLAFYVEHVKDGKKTNEYLAALNDVNTTLEDFQRLANGYMPKTTSVINIEYETKRKFYYYSDEFIDNLTILPLDILIPYQLKRLFKILHNQSIFLNYLTSKTLSFHKGADGEGLLIFMPWWKRLRETKLRGIKANVELLREYSFKMNKHSVRRRAIHTLASSAVYDDRLDSNFLDDYTDFLADISDNEDYRDGRIYFVGEQGEVLEDIYGHYLSDYGSIKAKKEKYLRNRKKTK